MELERGAFARQPTFRAPLILHSLVLRLGPALLIHLTHVMYVLLQGRNKTRVVSYRCPGNTAVQVKDLDSN